MAKLPRAPDITRLRATPPSVITIGPDLLLHRIYKRGGTHPTLWNTFRNFGPVSRFDHHLLDDNGDAHLQERRMLSMHISDTRINQPSPPNSATRQKMTPESHS